MKTLARFSCYKPNPMEATSDTSQPPVAAPANPAGRFIAVGDNGQRIVSSNGVDWHDPQLGKEGEIYRAAAFGNGRFAAVGTYGGQNIYASSSNGIDWKIGNQDAHYVSYMRSLGYGNGAFIALGGDPGSVGSSNPFVLFSNDGITWTPSLGITGKNILRRLAWGKDRFVAVGDRGRRAMSRDGKIWEDAAEVKAIDTLVDVAYGNGVFVGVGLNGLRMTTADGLKWTNRLVGEEGEHCNSILFTGTQFVAVGQGATYFSPDGLSWMRVENKDYPLVATYGAGLFIGSAWKGRLLHSTDAINWKQVYKSEYHFEAMCFGSV